MKSTGIKLILISFLLALVAAAFVFWYFISLKASNQSVKKTAILVAAETIPARTLIDKKMIKEIEIADSELYADYLKYSSDIIGKYTKETIIKNEGFHRDMLLDKNSDELSVKLGSEHRAVSINVTGSSGVSDLLKPGDFVDIVVYLAEKKDGQKLERPDVAKIILQNIEVLAVDKDLNRDPKTTAASDKDKEKDKTSFLVTLSVQTTDIEKLFLSENIGSLKLALRPIKDNKTIDTKGTAWQELLSGSDPNLFPKTDTVNTNKDKKYTNYTIKHGDTLKKISMDFYGDESKYTIIKEANNIEDEDLILSGEVIKIPIL